MNALFSMTTPLQSIFWPKENTFVKQTLLVLMGVFILALTSQLSIPFQPVPLTFQSTTVILIGMAYGARLGAYTIGAYLLAGILGFPIFEGYSSGLGIFLGPTCGYLLGFIPAVFLSGFLAQKGWAKNVLTSFASACLGTSFIFLLGASVLATFVGWKNAIAFGVMPFIFSEFIKLLAVAVLAPRLWKK